MPSDPGSGRSSSSSHRSTPVSWVGPGGLQKPSTDYASALRHGGARHGFVVHPQMSSLQRQRTVVPPDSQGSTLVRWMLKPGHRYESARDAWSPFHRLADPDPVRRREVAALARDVAEAEARYRAAQKLKGQR